MDSLLVDKDLIVYIKNYSYKYSVGRLILLVCAKILGLGKSNFKKPLCKERICLLKF